jgi:hypothetical protein
MMVGNSVAAVRLLASPGLSPSILAPPVGHASASRRVAPGCQAQMLPRAIHGSSTSTGDRIYRTLSRQLGGGCGASAGKGRRACAPASASRRPLSWQSTSSGAAIVPGTHATPGSGQEAVAWLAMARPSSSNGQVQRPSLAARQRPSTASHSSPAIRLAPHRRIRC